MGTEDKWHLEQAYIFEEKNDLENALHECELALQFAPDNAEVHNLRGLILVGIGRKEEALAAYREAVRLDSTFQEAQENLREVEAELKVEPRETKTESPITPTLPVVTGKNFGIRAGAYLIDNIILIASDWGAGFIGGILMQMLLAAFGQRYLAVRQDLSIWQWIIGLIIFTIYFTLFEWLFGASPGKLILRMRVVQVDGHACTLWAAFIRDLLRNIDGLVFAMPAYSSMKKTPLRQRLGDRAAKTIVVDYRDPIIQERRPWWGFVVAGVLCFTLNMIVLDATALTVGQIIPIKALVLIRKAAADINLRSNDLDVSFTQLGKDKLDLFPNDKNVTDANQRLFASKSFVIQSRVVMFRTYIPDKTSEMATAVEHTVRDQFKDQTLMFGPATNITVSERGSIQKFSGSAGYEGYTLFFIKQNVLVHVIVYGLPEKVKADDVQTLAHTIEERIR